jgi:precorrin-6A/cobalt-precorrin-6A reductase
MKPTVAKTRVLILGGTTEAAALAESLAGNRTLEVISSLAGRTHRPRPLPGTVRIGGFGGDDGLARYLKDERIDALIDATHPFADEISKHAAGAAERAGVPRLILTRPEWRAVTGDRWIVVADLDGAAEVLRKRFDGTRAFLAVGSGSLSPFAELSHRSLLVRVAQEPEGLPLPGSVVFVDRGPFTEAQEIALLRSHRIDVVVSKNSGGDAVYGKIAAARDLGIPVVMVARPPCPPGDHVRSVDAAARWLVDVVLREQPPKQPK